MGVKHIQRYYTVPRSNNSGVARQFNDKVKKLINNYEELKQINEDIKRKYDNDIWGKSTPRGDEYKLRSNKTGKYGMKVRLARELYQEILRDIKSIQKEDLRLIKQQYPNIEQDNPYYKAWKDIRSFADDERIEDSYRNLVKAPDEYRTFYDFFRTNVYNPNINMTRFNDIEYFMEPFIAANKRRVEMRDNYAPAFHSYFNRKTGFSNAIDEALTEEQQQKIFNDAKHVDDDLSHINNSIKPSIDINKFNSMDDEERDKYINSLDDESLKSFEESLNELSNQQPKRNTLKREIKPNNTPDVAEPDNDETRDSKTSSDAQPADSSQELPQEKEAKEYKDDKEETIEKIDDDDDNIEDDTPEPRPKVERSIQQIYQKPQFNQQNRNNQNISISDPVNVNQAVGESEQKPEQRPALIPQSYAGPTNIYDANSFDAAMNTNNAYMHRLISEANNKIFPRKDIGDVKRLRKLRIDNNKNIALKGGMPLSAYF